VTNKCQKNMPKTSTRRGLTVPNAMTIAMSEIADNLREGLLALAVGASLQVMGSLMEAVWRRYAGLTANAILSAQRCAAAVSAGPSPWAAVGSARCGRGCVRPAAPVRCRSRPASCSAAARSWAGWR
jgi:hypothetical protein